MYYGALSQLLRALREERGARVQGVVGLGFQVGYDNHAQPEGADQVGPANVRGPVMTHVDARRAYEQNYPGEQGQQRGAEPALLQVGIDQVEKEAVKGYVVH